MCSTSDEMCNFCVTRFELCTDSYEMYSSPNWEVTVVVYFNYIRARVLTYLCTELSPS
jgi:hypothetical protein